MTFHLKLKLKPTKRIFSDAVSLSWFCLVQQNLGRDYKVEKISKPGQPDLWIVQTGKEVVDFHALGRAIEVFNAH